MAVSKGGESGVVVRRHLSVGRLRDALSGVLSSDELCLVSGWELLGDIVIMELPEELLDRRFLIGETVLRLHPKAFSVMNRIAIRGVFRKPRVELIAGSKTVTLHRENGCVFRIDPSCVMFSFGNFEERKRMATVSCEEEVVVDMFSCVGQFCVPLAKHSSPRLVYALEKNSVAFGFLVENVELNKLGNMRPIFGDCREVAPLGVADRVVMGYLFETSQYLPAALGALKDGGGVIHFHTTAHRGEINDVIRCVGEIVKGEGRCVDSVESRVVKSYAPKVFHFVLDIVVS